jgi:(+)-trans-carveol dehydrogenase
MTESEKVMKFEGKVALITGAARGQGRSHAVRLAEEGADVIATDICEQIDVVPYEMSTKADLDETVRQVEALGRRVVARVADVRSVDQMESAVEDGVAQLGRLDIVCANAGITGPLTAGSSLGDRVHAFRQVVDTNLTGTFVTIEATKKHLIAGGAGGSIIITSSLAAFKTLGAGGGYGEAKHGLMGLMKAAAHELAPYFIRVNSIHPSNVDTPMIMNDALFRVFRPDLKDPSIDDAKDILQFLNLMPVPYLDVSDISNAVIFLASDEGQFITGVSLPIDAGGSIK